MIDLSIIEKIILVFIHLLVLIAGFCAYKVGYHTGRKEVYTEWLDYLKKVSGLS